jgi:hypothetical protein
MIPLLVYLFILGIDNVKTFNVELVNEILDQWWSLILVNLQNICRFLHIHQYPSQVRLEHGVSVIVCMN